MFEFLWNLHQSRRIGDLERQIAERRHDPAAKADELTEFSVVLQDRIDKLLLINMAMWSILEEKLGITEADLAQRVQDIDLRDGTLDGRPPQAAAVCKACNRPISRRHQRCLYCGGQTGAGSPFAGV